VLTIHGYNDPEILKLSDDVFTAFRLTTYMRNVKSDLLKNRVFIPEEDFQEFGYSEADLRMGIVNERFRNLIKSRWKKTRALYETGKPLIKHLEWPLSWQIKLKWLRGNLLLRKIRRYGFDTVHRRPRLKKWDWPRLMGGVLLP
jgi:phytoene synthase